MFIFNVHQFRTLPASNANSTNSTNNTNTPEKLDNLLDNFGSVHPLTSNQVSNIGNNYIPSFYVGNQVDISENAQRTLLENAFALIKGSGEYDRWKMMAYQAATSNNAKIKNELLRVMENEIKASPNVKALVEDNSLLIIAIREKRESQTDQFGENEYFGFPEKQNMISQGYRWFASFIKEEFPFIDGNNNKVLDVFDIVDSMQKYSSGYVNYINNNRRNP